MLRPSKKAAPASALTNQDAGGETERLLALNILLMFFAWFPRALTATVSANLFLSLKIARMWQNILSAGP